MAHRVHSLGKVPFSWENAPGVRKSSGSNEGSAGEYSPEFVYEEEEEEEISDHGLKLPPPPCPAESPRISVQRDIHIPLPPCHFQPPPRSCSRKGPKREDPFLAAYMECTKKGEQGKSSSSSSSWRGGQIRSCTTGIRGRMNSLSCKQSCGIRDNNSTMKVVIHRSRPRSREVIFSGTK